MKKGIILIACGHPNYGNMAYQLAVSIKTCSPDIPVTLVTTSDEKGISHLKEDKRSLFENIFHLPDENWHSRKTLRTDYFKVKTCIYDLSPYDETLYFDADMLWLPRKNITDLFKEFENINFTMSNRGSESISKAHEGFIHWAKPKEIVEAYGFKDEILFNLSSEFIYFKKNKEVKKLFSQAKKNFDNPKVTYKLFGNNQPDELSFSIAMMQTGIYPHLSPFIPTYWHPFHKRTIPLSPKIYNDFYLMSFGGAFQEQTTIEFYNNLAQFYMNKLGQTRTKLISKREFLPERVHI